jgi:hypothetical protein
VASAILVGVALRRRDSAAARGAAGAAAFLALLGYSAQVGIATGAALAAAVERVSARWRPPATGPASG